MDNRPSNSGRALDNTAVALSGLCLLHCLLLPFIVAALPFLGTIGEGHFHLQMLLVVIPVSSIALVLGYRKHRKVRIVAWGVLGMLMLIGGATIAHNELGLIADRLFTITGALTLAVTHYYNSRLSRRHR